MLFFIEKEDALSKHKHLGEMKPSKPMAQLTSNFTAFIIIRRLASFQRLFGITDNQHYQSNV